MQPLDVPSQVWADISMDFIEGLPKVGSKSVILTIVDRFSKYAHFIALGHSYTAASVAHAFFDGIVRLHGFSTSIASDRDPVFTGNVWRDLFKMAGVTLRMSMAFHPQTDDQSEVVNKVIAMYLRCVDWLSWAEYCYNTSFHTALRATPFKVVYGRSPPAIQPYQPGTARTEATDALLRSRDEMLAEVRQRLICRRSTTTPTTGMWSLRSARGCGCVSFTAWRSPSTPVPGTSSGRIGPGRSGCSSASDAWRTVYSSRKAPVCMMSSTSASSSSTTATL
jgi:hypothetical protein